MTKRSDLKKHIYNLQEIENIVSAMKNLSLIEISKTTKYLSNQEKVVATIEKATDDFNSFFPYSPSFQNEPINAYILVGSERGFCGDFNETIIKHFLEIKHLEKQSEQTLLSENPFVIIVGHKLTTKISDATFLTKDQLKNKIKFLDGSSAFEEIHGVISKLVKTLEEINIETNGKIHPGSWSIIFNQEIQNKPQTTVLQPFSYFGLFNVNKSEKAAKKNNLKKPTYPPLLNVKPDQFFTELLDQYLFAILLEIFFKSFMTENRQRLLHMENAIQWLDNNMEKLSLKFNALRQEEITEEIEVILLSAKAIIEKMELSL